MSLMGWVGTEVPDGIRFANDMVEEYEIFKQGDDKFFITRLVAECDDIGPLPTFNSAESVVMKLAAMLVAFEEQAWKICAAESLRDTGQHAPIRCEACE